MRTMTTFSMFLLAACNGASLPSAAVDGDNAGKEDSYIQGGSVDDADPAVGLVWIRSGGFCTGSLIAPNVVLTAGHCVESDVSAFYTGTGDGTTAVGLKPASGFIGHTVVDQVAHPSYESLDECPNPTFDVALLRLSKPIAGVTPLVVATSPPLARSSCTAVGFGVHDSGDQEIMEEKRRSTEKVVSVGETYIEITKGTGVVDHGDSGGPLVCKKQIVGVTSCGNDSSPEHTQAYYGRIDTVGDWIAETVARWR